MLVPFSYSFRSLFVRRSSTLLTVLGIGATVAVVSGILALQQGFASLFAENGREDVAVFLRPGSVAEGVSMFSRDRALKLAKTLPEIAEGKDGQPLASMESFLAVRRFKVDGGETNVPIRGVQPQTFEIRDQSFEMLEGRRFTEGSDEVIVGHKLTDRIRDCRLGDVIEINVTPFKVVGVFTCDGPFESEIWGDFDRMNEALERYGPNRLIAQLKPDVDIEELDERLREHKEIPSQVDTEREYLASQTNFLSTTLQALGIFLGIIMGMGAVFTATNTMLAAVASRTHEIGILLSTGFRPFPIFLSFLFESLLLGLAGGAVGSLMVLPINGVETGTTNFDTFTEIAFAFRITPGILLIAIAFSLLLGLLGGAWPAWRAARMRPTEALRRH